MKMRVAYIPRPYKDKVYSYPFLVTSYRDKDGVARNKTIMKLSKLPEHAVAALDAALRSDEDIQMVPKQSIRFYDAIPFGDTWAAFRLAEDLGIIETFNQFPKEHQVALTAMITDRVINPKPYSKRALSDTYKESALSRIINNPSTPELHEWYRSLKTLYAHQIEIQKRLSPESVDKVFLYDITSSYFEDKCCPLAAFGYNRDGKKGKMQIIIGLLTTSSGRPVATRVLEGNTADLFVQPIRHWNPDRVRGHIFMCMLAYLIVWEARRRLDDMLQRDPETRECEGKSLCEIWKTLQRVSIGYINLPGEQIEQISIINLYQSKILKKLGASVDKKARERLSL